MGVQSELTVSVPAPLAPGAVAVRAAASPEGLAAIAEPGTAAVLCQRRLDPALAAWLDGLPVAALPRLRGELSVDAVGKAVEAACEAAGTPATAERSALIADIARLAEGFAAAAGTTAVAVRLDVVQGDSCRRFHIDNVRLRLLCTYRGDGTEYGVAASGGVPDPVHRVPRGMPAAFRGRRWPGEVTGLAHRSPPIAGTGQTRLLLVIDPDEPDEDDQSAIRPE